MSRRRVSVFLELFASQYLTEADKIFVRTKATDKAIDELGDEVDDLGRDLSQVAANADVAATAIDDVGDEARGSAVGVALLDREIEKVTRSLLEMRAAAALPGGGTVDLAERILGEERELARLRRLMRAFTPGGRGGRGGGWGGTGIDFSRGLSESRGMIIFGLVGLAALAAPAIGAVVGGAVTGAVGSGGIIGGMVAASMDPRVKAAWKRFGESFSMEDFAGPAFVQPTLGAVDELQDAFDDLDLDRALAKMAPHVITLTRGIGDLARNFMPGFNAVLDRSGPFIDAMADGLGDFGSALGDMIDDMSSSEGSIEGMVALFDLLSAAARFTGSTVNALADIFDYLTDTMEGTSSAMAGFFAGMGRVPGVGAVFGALDDELFSVNKHIREWNEASERRHFARGAQTFGSAFEDMAAKAARVRSELDRINDALGEMFEPKLAAKRAELAAKLGLRDLPGELRRGTPLEDELALLDMVDRVADARDRMLKAPGADPAAVDKWYDSQIDNIIRIGVEADVAKSKLEALNGYKVSVTVDVSTRAFLSQALRGVFRMANVPGFAHGGVTPTNSPFVVGERGPEVMASTVPWQVTPAQQWMGGPSGGGGGLTVRVVVEDTSGRVLRDKLVTDAMGRGTSQAEIRVAYP